MTVFAHMHVRNALFFEDWTTIEQSVFQQQCYAQLLQYYNNRFEREVHIYMNAQTSIIFCVTIRDDTFENRCTS